MVHEVEASFIEYVGGVVELFHDIPEPPLAGPQCVFGLLLFCDVQKHHRNLVGCGLECRNSVGPPDPTVVIGELPRLPRGSLRGGSPIALRHFGVGEGRESFLDGLAHEA